MSDEVAKKLSTVSSIDGKEIKDELGRKIVLRKADIMDRFYLLRAMGADADKSSLVNMMYPTVWVAAIDGSPFPTPKTLFECEAALKRLGEEGVIAVTKEMNQYYEDREKQAEAVIKK